MLLTDDGDPSGMKGGMKKFGGLPIFGIPFGKFIGGVGNIVPGKLVGLDIGIGIGGIDMGLGIN